MRNAIFLLAPLSLLALSACTTAEGTDIQYLSTFDGGTRGVILHEQGNAGHAGMFSSNCPFDTSTGQVTGDYDLPDSDEDVQDGEPTVIGPVSLAAVIPGTVHVLDKTDGEYTHVPIEIEGVRQGRLTWDGVVGLSGDCTVSWVSMESEVRATTQLRSCSGEFEVDPATGLAFVSGPTSVLIDGESTLESAVSGDLVAFDDVAQVFYVATRGQATLSAVTLDGAELWTVSTEGPVTALDDGGGTGTAGVVLELQDGGAVAFYEGLDGSLSRFAETPTAADDLAVSGNGSVVALVRPDQVFFYALGE